MLQKGKGHMYFVYTQESIMLQGIGSAVHGSLLHGFYGKLCQGPSPHTAAIPAAHDAESDTGE